VRLSLIVHVSRRMASRSAGVVARHHGIGGPRGFRRLRPRLGRTRSGPPMPCGPLRSLAYGAIAKARKSRGTGPPSSSPAAQLGASGSRLPPRWQPRRRPSAGAPLTPPHPSCPLFVSGRRTRRRPGADKPAAILPSAGTSNVCARSPKAWLRAGLEAGYFWPSCLGSQAPDGRAGSRKSLPETIELRVWFARTRAASSAGGSGPESGSMGRPRRPNRALAEAAEGEGSGASHQKKFA
jgi:hypothetical protein